jgi:hypothetical protein
MNKWSLSPFIHLSHNELYPIINKDIVCPQGICEGNWKVTDIILEMIRRQYPDK